MTNPRPAAPSARESAPWRNFPAFEKLLASEDGPALFQQVEKTLRDLDRLRESGQPAEKSRANLAITAYGRTMELVRKVKEEWEKQAQ